MDIQTAETASQQSGLLTQFDTHLFTEGRHLQLYDKLGAHLTSEGTAFSVWAPNARAVAVVGDFNDWNPELSPLTLQKGGVWYGSVPGVRAGRSYQFEITSARQGQSVRKADPIGFRQEKEPGSRSVVWDLRYQWADHDWMARRSKVNALDAPISTYQVDLASWRRVPEEGNRVLSYRELAPALADYVTQHGFTHVQLLSVMEHAGSAAQNNITGFFAAASVHGNPEDLMFLIECLHQRQLGVILEWVPTHFPQTEFGLTFFDGTQLYEHGPWTLARAGEQPSHVFDYSRGEVRSFLLSNAFFWLTKFHADGLYLRSIGPMLYLDYGRKEGEWIPNEHGGRENLEGISFTRQLNEEIYRYFPDVQTFAGNTDLWPMVSRPTCDGGLGFGLKSNDAFRSRTLGYFKHDPFFRKFHHDEIAFRAESPANENLILPLSYEGVSRGRGSLLAQMPGDEWQRLANLRLLFGYQFLQPGKKLLFMGDEFAQWNEWSPDASLDWHLCQFPNHSTMQRWVDDLNHTYRTQPALHRGDNAENGFEWVERHDAEQSSLSWLRRDPQRHEVLLVVCNFTPVVRPNFRVGVRRSGRWSEILNSDAQHYGGSGQGNFGQASTVPFSSQGLPHTLVITLPPLAVTVFKHEGAT